MADPFQDLSSAAPEIIDLMIETLEIRMEDPEMIAIMNAYIQDLDWPVGGTLVEIGCGTGAVARPLAEQYAKGKVIGIDPSPHLIEAAQQRATGFANLSFETGNGATLHLPDQSADIAVMQTVLSHVIEPQKLVDEAARILKPGGQLVICDADFAKLSIALDDGDPLEACVAALTNNFVTDRWLTAKLRPMLIEANLEIEKFDLQNRLDLHGGAGRIWVKNSTTHLVRTGIIGQPLADALMAEYERRVETGSVYGFMPMVTAIGRKTT
jgi:ubiquinone/menaquinone biosynthesis C-methylase UbiE